MVEESSSSTTSVQSQSGLSAIGVMTRTDLLDLTLEVVLLASYAIANVHISRLPVSRAIQSTWALPSIYSGIDWLDAQWYHRR